MSKYIGQKIGRFVVTRQDYDRTAGGNLRSMFTVRCSCGAIERKAAQRLLRATVAMCATCRAAEFAKRSGSGYKHPLYATWLQMVTRCHDPKSPGFAWYGARGIRVCDAWLGARAGGELATVDGFRAFAAAMGAKPTPGHSLDRKDNDGPYSPENCRWATATEQANNTRANVQVTCDGVTKSVTEWGRAMGHKNPDMWAFAARKYGVSLPDALGALVGRPQPRSWVRAFIHAGLLPQQSGAPTVAVTVGGVTRTYADWLLLLDISTTAAYARKRGRSFTELVAELAVEKGILPPLPPPQEIP